MSALHIANLSNGVLCAPPGAMLTRIQSTACEQKRWSSVLASIPDHALVVLADGGAVVVHDQSERARVTRAQWQGLSFARFALRRAWGLDERPEFSRNGMRVNRYWSECFNDLPAGTLTRLRYFQRYVSTSDVRLAGCGCERVAARVTP